MLEHKTKCQSDDSNNSKKNTLDVIRQQLQTENGVPIVRWLVLQRIYQNRRMAIQAIKCSSKRVTINNQECSSLAQLVHDGDKIEVDRVLIECHLPIKHVYYILNKPRGCLSSRRNMKQIKGGGTVLDSRPTIYDYIPEKDRPYANSIGRLDFDTTGLMIFTSDGLLCERLANPQYKVAKIYRCTLRTAEPLSDGAINQLQNDGVKLPHARGAVVRGNVWNVSQGKNPESGAVVDLQIFGGYTHQVKLMMALVNRPLRLLHRRTFANLELPSDLKEGQCREMSHHEVNDLYKLAVQQQRKHE
mmetsp:Transcript_29958/g.45415  ORF Transcript_29958/g.45415 Transcript_29958/m.45415 type:complete len:302 (+) Transcript_29958:3-908(+)